QGHGDAFAALDVCRCGADRFFHDHVADGIGNDLKDFQDGHAAANERGERACEAGQANLVRDDAEDRHSNAAAVPEFAAGFSFEVGNPPVDQGGANGHEVKEVVLDEVAEANQSLRGSREVLTKPLVDVTEHGDNFDEEEDGDANGDDGDRGRVHHRRFDFLAQLGRILEVGG